jgi:LysM repeat protein
MSAARRARRSIALVLVAGIISAALAPSFLHGSPVSVPAIALAAPALEAAGAPPIELEAGLLLARADDARRAADWTLCIELLTQAVALQPANAMLRERLYEAHTNLGWRLLVQRRFAEARQAFQAAIQLNPNGIGAPEGLRLLDSLTPCAALPPGAPDTLPAVATLQGGSAPATALSACPVVAGSGCSPVMHVVARGDTLFTLARRFGTTVKAIMATNNLTSTTIRIGQVLIIPTCCTTCATCGTLAGASSGVLICPPTSPPVKPTHCPATAFPTCPAQVTSPACECTTSTVRVHVVQRGDNLFRLAASLETSARLLMEVNGLTTTRLRVGQVLVIP